MGKFASRKLLIATAVVALVTLLLLAKAVSEAVWVDMVKLAVGGYLAANVGQKGLETMSDALLTWLASRVPALQGAVAPMPPAVDPVAGPAPVAHQPV